MIGRLSCTVMPYAWGSKTAIATLAGRPPSDEPEAELWMGAHPMAPSKLDGRSLDELVAAEPERMLGAPVREAFGERLPFLLKVLAAAEPLSLQAHPTAAQAAEGFAADEARGIARDAPHRNYRDASHKPELLCALTPFQALCGFRRIDDTLHLFDTLGVAALDDVLAPLEKTRDLRATFRAIMTDVRPDTVAAVVEAASKSSHPELALAPRLAKLYPGDAGIVSALLLNQVTLAPGEAIYLDAGNLHAYLDGTGVEIMASSDNVLRGGLTKKHVDVAELVRILDFVDGPVTPITADADGVYRTPAREFALSVHRPTKAEPLTFVPRGPEIVLCTNGAARVVSDGFSTALEQGASAFVAASTASYTLAADGGEAPTVYRATVNL